MSADGVALGKGGLAEGGELVEGDGEVLFAETGAVGTGAAVGGEEGRDGGVRALDEVRRPGVTDLADAAGGVVQQGGDRLRERSGVGLQMVTEFGEVAARADGGEQRGGGQGPHAVAGALGEGVEEEGLGGGESVEGHHVVVRGAPSDRQIMGWEPGGAARMRARYLNVTDPMLKEAARKIERAIWGAPGNLAVDKDQDNEP